MTMRIVTSSEEAIIREREALEALIQSEGWAVFEDHILREWHGSGLMERIGMSFQGEDPMRPKVLYETSLQMRRALDWPASRVDQLKGATTE